MPYLDKKMAQKKRNEWIEKHYDRVNLSIPKGEKELLQAFAKHHHVSVSGFIWETVLERMKSDFALYEMLRKQVEQEAMERELALLEELNNQE